MRFQIDSKVPFVAIQFTGKQGRKSTHGTALYLPWEHTLDKCHVEMLTCIEHHKVPNYWDDSTPPKLDCDGFIFKGADGKVWHNQYPRASYGQLDDRQDQIVSCASPSAVNGATDFVHMETAFHRLAEVHRGIYQFVHEENDAAVTQKIKEVYLPAMQTFAAQLQDLIEMAGGEKVVVEPLTYKLTDGEVKTLDGHFRARFESQVPEVA